MLLIKIFCLTVLANIVLNLFVSMLAGGKAHISFARDCSAFIMIEAAALLMLFLKYKFILCILVVFLHNKTADYFSLTEGQYRIYNFVTYYIPQLAVPSFMLISGYLMFRGHKKETARNKIIRRLAKLIPAYLFWNVVAIPYSVLVTGYSRQFSNIFDILSGATS